MLSDAFETPRLVPYLTYADPDPETFETLAITALEQNIKVLEIGMPFSDPIADGPVIQASHHRALQHNPKVKDILACVKRLRSKYDCAIILMGSINLVTSFGVESFFEEAQKSKVSGIVIPDLLFEEMAPYKVIARKNNIPIVSLMSPLCDQKRCEKMVEDCDGFLYLMARLGVTGESDFDLPNLSKWIKNIKNIKEIPVLVGFGISHPDHVKTVCGVADGAIVGSYLVRAIANATDPIETLKKELKFLQKGVH